MQLSVREAEVLKFLSKGFSNKEIADQIQLSVETVRTYLKSIYKKLHVRSRTEAVLRYGPSRPVNPTLNLENQTLN
jgi:DNA-binding NarL/FixJ family response regulator